MGEEVEDSERQQEEKKKKFYISFLEIESSTT